MKIGILTVGLSPMPLEEIIGWAADEGFGSVEVGCWPRDNRRAFNGTQLDVNQLDSQRAGAILAASQQRQMPITCLTYCDNMLARETDRRVANIEHLKRVINAAAMLNVATVCTFIGRDESRAIADNIELAGQVFPPILEYGAERGVRLCVENCPMPGWQFEGLVGNVAHSPAVWDRLFEVLPYDNFGLNLDPSHLHWLGIDPVRAAIDYGPKIFYAHAKDTEIIAEQRYRRGITDMVEGGWRRSRVPGLGGIDFQAFIQGLRLGGYDGPLSIELEDRDWIGSPEKVKQGMLLALKHLQTLL